MEKRYKRYTECFGCKSVASRVAKVIKVTKNLGDYHWGCVKKAFSWRIPSISLIFYALLVSHSPIGVAGEACSEKERAALIAPMPMSSMLLSLKGQMTQGGLIIGKTESNARVKLNGNPIKVSPAGDFVFGFGRDAALSHTLEISVEGQCGIKMPLTLKKREYNIQKITGIKKSIMQPSEANLKRIREEVALVKDTRKLDGNSLDFLQPFEWPLKGRITGVYGSQRYYNDVPKRPHYGIDIAAPKGTLVTSPAPGVVTMVHDDMFYSGGTIIVDHGFGVSSTFLHLSKSLVHEGDELKTGDPVGEVGSSGRSTGPHLDWRINWFGERIDPALVVEGPME